MIKQKNTLPENAALEAAARLASETEGEKLVPCAVNLLHSAAETLHINTNTLLSRLAYVSRFDVTAHTTTNTPTAREVSEVLLADDLLKTIYLLKNLNELVAIQLQNLEI